MKREGIYNDYFFSKQSKGSFLSAKIIIPLILQLIKPKSVVDFGCGLGTWLKAWQEHGVLDILGLDGDYVDLDKLYIDRQYFKAHDLSKPISLDKKYHLALSLEVAEHIKVDYAQIFIKNLVAASDFIVFSAAIPGQADLRIGHINEQWPEYWQNLFRQENFELLDPWRAKLFNNHQVEWWYRQNILLAVNNNLLKDNKFKNLAVYNKELKIIHSSVMDKYNL